MVFFGAGEGGGGGGRCHSCQAVCGGRVAAVCDCVATVYLGRHRKIG